MVSFWRVRDSRNARNTKPYFEKIGVACPKCGKDIVVRKTKKGRKYYGCENNPDCDFMVWQRPSNEKCERCGSIMLIKGNKLVCANESCGFVKKSRRTGIKIGKNLCNFQNNSKKICNSVKIWSKLEISLVTIEKLVIIC